MQLIKGLSYIQIMTLQLIVTFFFFFFCNGTITTDRSTVLLQMSLRLDDTCTLLVHPDSFFRITTLPLQATKTFEM